MFTSVLSSRNTYQPMRVHVVSHPFHTMKYKHLLGINNYKKLSIIKKINRSKMPNLDWTCTKVDLIRKIKDGPGSNCLDWYKEFFPFSDANKFMGVVLNSKKL